MKLFLFQSIFLLVVHSANCQDTTRAYSGKVLAGKGSCAWLILIEAGPEESMIGKVIEPSCSLPEHLQKKRKKVIFNFYPLRQPVRADCKSDIVGSIASIKEK
jgi:hypothetical protein